ncbi:MAG: glycosyltransferase family 1 protein [Gammaproteobacteria bacterium]|nr:MAG: glycosyltransferase family 1 protein [Gammaproteobacteria bacterium]
MHIADVTLFFAPHSGGVKRYLLAKHRHYAGRAGVRHSLVVPGVRRRETEPGIFELPGTRVPFGGGYRVPLRPSGWRRFLAGLAPDLIEVGDPYHLAWSALAAAEDCGAATVAYAHSDLPRMLAARFGSVVGRAADVYLRKLYSRFDFVQAPSRLIAQRLRASGIDRVVVQPLGVDGEVFHPSRREDLLRAQLGLPADTRLLIFAGRMAREKQIPLLLDTFAALGRPYHLLLVGGEERKRLAANVTLLPYEQESTRLARLLASADALVHAGAQETFGMIVIEAMACGVPVIGVRAGAVPELIDERVGALAEAGDARSLAQAIDQLYKCNLQQMGQTARARVEKRYAWSSTFALQLDRYARLTHRQTLPDFEAAADVAGLP